MRAIGYVRVSTGRQAKGISLQNQEERIRAWAKFNDVEDVQIFREDGKSGTKATNRPAFQAALKAVGKDDVLISYSLSRFARSVPDAYRTLELLRKRGASIVSLSESIDTTTASGRAFFGFLAVMAQLESELTGERVAATWHDKKHRGEKLGGAVPFGYTAKEKQLIPKPDEQKVIVQARRWHRQGWSLREIGRKLEAKGVPRKAGGLTWCAVAVNRVIQHQAQ